MAINSLTLNRQILRLSGLSSGLDTEGIVSGLLEGDQLKVDKQTQAKTRLEWKRDAYRDINTKLRTFRETYMSALDPENNVLSASAYKTYKVTMLDTTKSVSVSADSSATAGTLTIDSITQLAAAAAVQSSGIYNSDTLYMDTALKDLALTTPLVFEDGEIAFTINGQDFVFSENDEINDVINEINASAAGVRMSYSNLKKGFQITTTATGSESSLVIANTKGNAFSAVDSAFGIAEGTVNGQDAILNIEGIEVVRSGNAFTIDGISYSLQEATDTPVSFRVERDIDSVMDKITQFIDAYNTLVSDLQAKLDEEVHRAYDPLTDTQRESLSDSQEEQWEELAKSGLLHSDNNVSFLLNTMRTAFYTQVEGMGSAPSDIGLNTGAYYQKGQIIVDEAALRSALENNPEEVISMFTKQSTAEDVTDKYNQSGLVTRISDAFLQYTQQTTSISMDSLERQIGDAEDRIDALMDRMTQREEALWKKFTAMETALATMNSQSSWLQSIFSAQE